MIHQYKLNGYNIVLDVYSGSVHCVDDLAYDIIEMYENNSREDIINAMLEKYSDNCEVTNQEICDCIDDVEELKNEGKLFTSDKYENLAFDFKSRNIHSSTSQKIYYKYENQIKKGKIYIK